MSEHKPPTDDELAEMKWTATEQRHILIVAGGHGGLSASFGAWLRCIEEIKRLRAEVKRLKDGEARACEEALSSLKRTAVKE